MANNVPSPREVRADFPSSPTPATDYFIRQADGRIEHWISDLAAPHTLRPVSFNIAVTGAPPPTSVTRSGGAAGVTLSNVSYVEQAVRPTVNIPLTALVLENATAAGAGPVALAVLDVATATWLGAGTAAVSGSGLQAPVNLTLLAGREYRIRAGNLGSGVNGTQYDGYLASVTLGTGYTWTGLSTTGGVAYWDGTYKTVPDATQQLPLQYVTGDMTGFDPSGLTIQGTDPIQVTYDTERRTYTVGLSSGHQAFVSSQFASAGAIEGTTTAYLDLAPAQAVTLLGARDTTQSGNTVRLEVWDVATQTLLRTSAPVAGGTPALLSPPLNLNAGQHIRLGWHATNGNVYRVSTTELPLYPGWTSPPGSYLGSPAGSYPNGFVQSYTLGVQLIVGSAGFTLDDVAGLPEALADKASAASLTALAGRVTTLEARPVVDAEFIQDTVGAMIPGGTYDAAGTYTLPPDQTLTPEQVQDIVGAFIAAGTNATVTYDDAANTLTISSTGGGGTGAVISVAGRTGAVVLTSADLSDFTEAAQDAAASMLADSTDLDGTYADGGNTYAWKVTGLLNRAIPDTGTAGQSIRLNAGGTAWEFYTPGSGGGGGGSTSPVALMTGAPITATRSRAKANPTWLNTAFVAAAEITPTGAITVAGLREASNQVNVRLAAIIYDVATTAVVAISPTVNSDGGVHTALFSAPVPLTAGKAYRIGWIKTGTLSSGTTDMVPCDSNTTAVTFTGLGTVSQIYLNNDGNYPTTSVALTPGFDVLLPSTVTKGVTGPLDPVDVPRVTTQAELNALPNGGQALSTVTLPPRWVYRHTNGTLYYGAVYSTTP